MYTVRGVVLDAGNLQPIAGAEVWLSMIPVGPPAEPNNPPQMESRKVVTSRSGSFTFEGVVEGRFPIEARREGYVSIRRPFEDVDWVSVGSGESEEVRLLLARQPRLSGRIVQPDTRKPVAGIEVQAFLAFYQDGRRNLFPILTRAKSDSQGRFLFDSLLPGQYFLTVDPDTSVREHIVPGAAAEEKRPRGRLRTTWPDLRDLDTAVPILLEPGADLDLGELPLAEGIAYQATVRLRGEACSLGEKTTVQLSQSLGWRSYGRSGYTGVCVEEFLVYGLTPGVYGLLVQVEGPDSRSRRHGQSTLNVIDSDLGVDLFLGPGPSVAGRVVAPEQRPLPPGLEILLSPQGNVSVPYPYDYKKPVEADGAFSFTGLEGIPLQVTLTGLGVGFYVKSLEYNGTALAGGVLPLTLSSPPGSLVVVLSDAPAALHGRVMDGDRPARDPYVVLVPWPARDPYAQSRQSRGNRDGRFSFTGLPPGEYRVIGYREVDGDKLNEPGVLPSLLRKAKLVTLQERGIQNIEVELSRP